MSSWTHLDGMFALALWDSSTAMLGARPRSTGQEAAVLRPPSRRLAQFRLGAAGAARRRARRAGASIRSRWPSFCTTATCPRRAGILADVGKLEPGTMLTWSLDAGTRTHRYWTPGLRAEAADRLRRRARRARNRVREAVVARLMSEVPLGLFLSGGSRLQLRAGADGGGRSGDDRDVRDRLSGQSLRRALVTRARSRDRFGSVHHDALVEPSDLIELLPSLVRHYGEPFADSSAVPTFYLARWGARADHGGVDRRGWRRAVRRVLPPPGSSAGARLDLLPNAARRRRAPGGRPAGGFQRPTRCRRASGCTASSGRSSSTPGERYAEWTAALGAAGAHGAPLGGSARALSFDPPGTAHDPLDRALAVDFARSLPDQLLYKMDIATMASSLEARAPLLDYRLVEWAARLPSSFKQRGRTRKRLLTDALARHLPPELFTRPKMGFSRSDRRLAPGPSCTS